ncbi:MAG TPA: hypothetical protein VGF16_11275 [Bryobacteraceae bacterium]|jgi:hypothetical protein
MVTATWWLVDALLALLLFRACQQKLLTHYIYFYAYVAGVFASEMIRQYLYHWRQALYTYGWWISEFATAILGVCITWEIFSQMFRPYRGVQRMARFVLAALFSVVVFKAVVDLTSMPFSTLVPTTLELERNLRVLQALSVLVLLALMIYYDLPAGRNLRWMFLGYGSYLGCQVILWSVLSGGGDSSRGSSLLSNFVYAATLIVWAVGMWSVAPNPVSDCALEEDYERISGQTIRAFGRLREHLIQSWRG